MRAKRLEESSFDDEDDISFRVVSIEIGMGMFKLRLRISHCRFAIEESYHGISLETWHNTHGLSIVCVCVLLCFIKTEDVEDWAKGLVTLIYSNDSGVSQSW